jgi:simple sugar transport system permease protein
MIFGKWRPVQTMLACLFFGLTEAMTIQMQGVVKLPSGDDIPVQFIQMVPYVLTIVVLAGFIGHSRPPSALGRMMSLGFGERMRATPVEACAPSFMRA